LKRGQISEIWPKKANLATLIKSLWSFIYRLLKHYTICVKSCL